MYALAVQSVPEGKEWLYEVKFDGYRCLAGRDKSGVTLWSRRGNLFTTQLYARDKASRSFSGVTDPNVRSGIAVASATVCIALRIPESYAMSATVRFWVKIKKMDRGLLRVIRNCLQRC